MKHASVDKAKRVDSGCRNHGSCPWCTRSRTMARARIAAKVKSWEADGYAEVAATRMIASQNPEG